MGWSRKIAFAFKRPRKTDHFFKNDRFKDVLLGTEKNRVQEKDGCKSWAENITTVF